MNFQKPRNLLVTIIFFSFLCVGCNEKNESCKVPEYVFTYAENQAEDYPTTLGAYRFAELVNTRSDGRIKIVVEAEAALGSEKEVVKQLKFGGIDFTRVSLLSLTDDIPSLNVLCMPYLYRDAAHVRSVLDGPVGQNFFQVFPEKDLIGLSWYDAGSRNFYTSGKPITCLEDLANMQIRVQDCALAKDLITALHAIPVTAEFKDVYSALETGKINGAENNLPSYISTDHYELARYFTLDRHFYIPEIQLCSLSTWQKLSPKDQTLIKECAYESSQYEQKIWREQERSARDKLNSLGVHLIHLSPAELTRFQAAVQPLYEKYCSDYLDLVTEIRNYTP